MTEKIQTDEEDGKRQRTEENLTLNGCKYVNNVTKEMFCSFLRMHQVVQLTPVTERTLLECVLYSF